MQVATLILGLVSKMTILFVFLFPDVINLDTWIICILFWLPGSLLCFWHCNKINAFFIAIFWCLSLNLVLLPHTRAKPKGWFGVHWICSVVFSQGKVGLFCMNKHIYTPFLFSFSLCRNYKDIKCIHVHYWKLSCGQQFR
jgi:hypothetical protein